MVADHVWQDAPDRVRLLELSRESNSSLASLSGMLGRNPAYLQQFIRKGSPRRLEERDRRMLAQFFGVDERELGGPQDISYDSARPGKKDWIEVERLPLGASAGGGAVAGQEAPFDAFRFSSRWLREQGLDGAKLAAIRVEGDSMEPLLRDGDEILVDRSERPFRDGIYVVRLDDNLMVKRLASAGPGRVTLLSQNLAYPPVEVAFEVIAIIGRVVWKSGRV